MAEETEYLKAKLAAYTPKHFKWRENDKYKIEASEAVEDLTFRMDTGILQKYQLLRTKELERHVLKNCYSKTTDYNIHQAKRCEKYHMDNDYKLNLIGSFMKEHMWKHSLSYHNCTRTPEFAKLDTIEAKDRVYQKCHEEFIDKVSNKLEGELTERARDIFGSSD